jgi:hypothetical protein
LLDADLTVDPTAGCETLRECFCVYEPQTKKSEVSLVRLESGQIDLAQVKQSHRGSRVIRTRLPFEQ